MLNDLRHAVRVLRNSPGFTIVAVLTLVLGIGVNTAIFSVVRAVLLQPLPFQDPDRLVIVWEDATPYGFPRNTPAPANYADWKAENRVFEDMAALSWKNLTLVGGGEPEKLSAHAVTFNFFSVLGVEPRMGRTFARDDDRPGAPKVAVISHGLWQRRYGGARDIVGRDLLLDGEKHTVVGVMSSNFQFLEPYIAVWVPAAMSAEELSNRGGHYLTVVARLSPGVGLKEAEADVKTIMARIARAYPDHAGKLGAVVIPLKEQLTGDARRPLLLLLGAVACVLLIATANIANLLLSRAAGRGKEVAIRASLGAAPARIVRQFLTESLVLAGVGGVGGLIFAYWTFDFLAGLVPPSVELASRLRLDGAVLGYAFVITMLTGLGFGLAPALRSSKRDVTPSLRTGSGRGTTSAGENRLRGALVAGQLALATMLLVGAGLLVQTMVGLIRQYEELHAEQVLTVRTVLPEHKYSTPAQRNAFYARVLERVSALPGVTRAGYTTAVPLEWKGGTSGFDIEGQADDPNLVKDANHRQVSADYLRAMGVPLRRGRHLSESDSAGSMAVAVVNETMQRQYWRGDALGKRFRLADDQPWITIVGVVGDVRQMGVDAPVKAEMYLPYAQMTIHQWFAPRSLAVRTTTDPAGLVGLVRQEIRAIDPEQPVSNIRTMDEVLGEETAQRRLGTTLLGAFACLALTLASLGIYGVLSYFVVQHTSEIGVRVALGADSGDVLRLVLGRSGVLVGGGLTAGLIGAAAFSRVLRGLLFGIDAVDPKTFVAVAALLGSVALLASYLPARRAARIDPAVALRAE
jgi:putative ABC transport system permease protein